MKAALCNRQGGLNRIMVEKLYMIKEDQLFFLRTNLSNRSLLDKFEKAFETGNLTIKYCKTNRYQIYLTEKEISILLDELTLLLTSKGLKKNDEPNNFGLFVEELIDVFSK